MPNNDPGPAQAAWREFTDVLRDADLSFLNERRGAFDEYEMASGYRNLTHILAFAVGLYMYGDPDWPVFLRPLYTAPTEKTLGETPDAHYRWGPVRGDRRYRITGQRGDEVYLGFTIHRGTRGSGREQYFDPTRLATCGRPILMAPAGCGRRATTSTTEACSHFAPRRR
jgi:hypothetical protein